MIYRESIANKIGVNDIEKWIPEELIIISAGTGKGKSYFIKNNLYEYAKRKDRKILFLLHRSCCVKQFQMEIEAENKQDVIAVMTYQKLEAKELWTDHVILDEYDYVVCDEFHYFVSDARFNRTTDISFQRIIKTENAIKIFMSATGEDVKQYIQQVISAKIKEYVFPEDWSFISSLTFYMSDETLNECAKMIIEEGKKAIIFIQSAEKAYGLYKEFKKYAVFNCSEQNGKYSKYVDRNKIDKILENQYFAEALLITTSCMDAGINIIDLDLKYIFADIQDVGSLTQCIGRKRRQSRDDTVAVFVKTINNQQLGGLISSTKRQLEMAEYLRVHTVAEWLEKYPRATDISQIIYDDKSNDENFCTKKVNEMMYYKKKYDISTYEQMLRLGKYGYCKYLARKFGKYSADEGYYDYKVIGKDLGLEKWLASQIGKEMLRRPDRKELIEKMNVKRDGHLKHSREILNSALKEDNLPFRIEEFETTKESNGKKKKFRSAWRIVSHDWSVK